MPEMHPRGCGTKCVPILTALSITLTSLKNESKILKLKIIISAET